MPKILFVKIVEMNHMKVFLSLIGIGFICLAIFLCSGRGQNATANNDDFLRIHIVANSNSYFDKDLKYKVKDVVVDFLIPKLADAQTKDEAVLVVLQNLDEIEEVTTQTLKESGANYGCKISVMKENMPLRAYDDLVLEEGIYECLKIELGQAKGNNWWCVVFPAVCFLSSENSQNYVYISKIWEIINSVTR